jgi:hypothetical protein
LAGLLVQRDIAVAEFLRPGCQPSDFGAVLLDEGDARIVEEPFLLVEPLVLRAQVGNLVDRRHHPLLDARNPIPVFKNGAAQRGADVVQRRPESVGIDDRGLQGVRDADEARQQIAHQGDANALGCRLEGIEVVTEVVRRLGRVTIEHDAEPGGLLH